MYTYPERSLPDGRVLALLPLTFDRFRLCVSAADDRTYFQDLW